MKSSRVAFIKLRYPLVEKRLTRQDCIDWLADRGLPVPIKSACVGCPHRSASEWLQMADEAPDEFGDACRFDEENRHNPLAARGGSTADQLYLWKGRIPLAAVDLAAESERERVIRAGRGSKVPSALECESGYCHV